MLEKDAIKSVKKELKRTRSRAPLSDSMDLRRDLKEARTRLKNLFQASKKRAWNELLGSIQENP